MKHRTRATNDLLAPIFAFAFALAATPASAVVVNKILATVDGKPVTLYELKKFTLASPVAQQLGENNPGAILDGLITSRLIELEIEKNGISVADAEIDNYIAQIQQQNQISKEDLFKALSEQGMSEELYRKQIREELERAQLINREIRGKVSVTPEDVQRYYEANQDDYSQAPEVSVSTSCCACPKMPTTTRSHASKPRLEKSTPCLNEARTSAISHDSTQKIPLPKAAACSGPFASALCSTLSTKPSTPWK